ncbi:MAG TPA: hypothetical protein VIV12_11365 [Streptosporangiaceae bacterium]
MANTEWRDILNFLLGPPRVSAYRTTAVSTATAVWARADLTGELYDSYGTAMHDTGTNPSRLVAPETMLYECHASLRVEANATGLRGIAVCKQTAGTYDALKLVKQETVTPAWSAAWFLGLSTDVQLNAGEHVEMFGRQESGGALDMFGGGIGQTFMSLRGVTKQ